MPHGCWIDLYETADLSGERRRVFGPGELDAFVWLRFAAADTVSVHVGPDAVARLVDQSGTERRLAPNAVGKAIAARAISTIAIQRAPETCDDQTDDGRQAVHREIGDPPAPSNRRRHQSDQVDDAPAASGVEGDETP